MVEEALTLDDIDTLGYMKQEVIAMQRAVN